MTESERRLKSLAATQPPVLPVPPVHVPPVHLAARHQDGPQGVSQAAPTAAPVVPAALALAPASAMTETGAQKQAARPVLEAAHLSRLDQTDTQHAARQLAVQRQALGQSAATLAANGLRPQPEHLLPRFAPPPPPIPPQLTPVQRQALEVSADHTISSALSANARYLPPAARVDLAAQAIQRFGQQGLDAEALRALMVQRSPDDATREAAQGTVALQRRREQEQAQQRSDHALLTRHAMLQRQLKETEGQHAVNQADLVERIKARRGGGQPLPDEVRQQLERGLNHDLSGVRVHTDAEADLLAKQVQATAFTSGKDIYFQSGEFDPVNKLELLAHEVTHVRQQDSGLVGPGLDPDAGLEAEAKANETGLLQRGPGRAAQPARAGAAPPVAVQRRAGPVPSPAQPPAHATAPRTAALSVDETVRRLREISAGVPATSPVVQAELRATLALRGDDPAFWTQVAALGERSGPGFVSSALALLPRDLQTSLGLALRGGEAELTYEAFISQLSAMAGSAAPDLPDQGASASTSGGAQAILQAAGYRARPTLHGLWGFQLRVFEPVNAQARYDKTVVAFGGTEGLALPPAAPARGAGPRAGLADSEGERDSVADLTAHASAHAHYEANHNAIVAPLLKSLGTNLVATGHSLGGGLAQIAAAQHPGQFSEVRTFQAVPLSRTDGERLAKQNAALQTRPLRVPGNAGPGDGGPTPGDAALNGDSGQVRRGASGATIQNLSAVGGHNAPVALELLRELARGNAIDKSNKLAQALIQHGSLDAADERGSETGLALGRRSPGGQDTAPGQEASEQDKAGKLYLNTFVNTYKNNAVYNILAEEAFKPLGEIGEGTGPGDLVSRLLAIADEVNAQPVRHTESSWLMLKVIFENVEKDAARWPDHTAGKLAAQHRQDCESLEFNSRIIDENKERFRKNILDLWYSLNPDKEQLYLEAWKLLPQQER